MHASTNGRTILRQDELLLVTAPVVRANVNQVLQRFQREQDETTTNVSVDRISEQVLLEACQSCHDRGIVNSCTALEGASCSDVLVTNLDRFLGKDTTTIPLSMSDSDWLQIIRRNAFGADFITADYVQQRWQASSTDTIYTPGRLLALYPLAAMMNHSCVPNAVRVYQSDLMLVHACQTIPCGHEITWSYIPVIDTYPIRQTTLKTTHGFICTCERCRQEAILHKTNEHFSHVLSKQIAKLCHDDDNADKKETISAIHEMVSLLENDLLLPTNTILTSSNEVKRYIRVGFLRLYLKHVNHSLLECQQQTDTAQKKELLKLCTQLHFSLASCHNASTEHLSVSTVSFIKAISRAGLVIE
jgi:hypothetical protein